jgi:hypothetical protein
MDISKLPTDNLYKFLAIFGLIIFLASFYPYIVLSELETSIGEVKDDSEIVYKKFSSHKDWIDKLSQLADSTKDKKLIEKIFDISLEEKEKIDFYYNEGLVVDKELNIIKNKLEQATYLFYVCLGTQAIGFMLMYFGFKFWYQRLQKYQDMIIKREALRTYRSLKRIRTYFTI